MLQRIDLTLPHPLFDAAGTREIEHLTASALPPHTLMQRAGRATARLARALAPHARQVWVACGGGNNGGDGLEAAALLQDAGAPVVASLLADPARLPADARRSWERARAAGVRFADAPPVLGPHDLAIDALLGLGLAASAQRGVADPRLLHWLGLLRSCPATVLAMDMPSGLLADTGQFAPGLGPAAALSPPAARHTLALLTLKPGLFTAQGRDAAGTVWLDSLGTLARPAAASAWLAGAPARAARPHASHKGSFGDVAIVGGEGLKQRGLGMTGAALLAASAALHGGAGRVLLSLLASPAAVHVPPELMLRRLDALALESLTVVAGCGGGAAIAPVLPGVLVRAARLVLDADALNAIAADPALARLLQARASQPGRATVLTPHPLEAARLLGSDTPAVQADRLAAAQALAQRLACTVVLKGSGSIIAAPGRTPRINPTGNARLATAGTGDVLAGLLGSRLASAPDHDAAAFDAACAACWQHGAAADAWPAHRSLTAGALAERLSPV